MAYIRFYRRREVQAGERWDY
ncbi:MAG: hypothetical protein UU34_C0015G0001, partial [Candidatus Curtissbacteria bacterium GW2011_GWA1_41_11]